VLLAGGTKGKRFALPNARILIHQGSGGFSGAIPDIEVAAREALTLSAKCMAIIAAHSGQPYEKVKRDSDRDFYMTAQEAKEYGLIDEVLEPLHKPGAKADEGGSEAEAEKRTARAKA
jgi:ATP-dependent Clp protease protease subunit